MKKEKMNMRTLVEVRMVVDNVRFDSKGVWFQVSGCLELNDLRVEFFKG